MRLLLVASDPMEFAGLRGAGWKPARRCGAPSGPGAGGPETRPQVSNLPHIWSRSVRLGGHDLLLVANGAGAQRAAAAVDAAAEMFQPDSVISTGFCGALDPQLGVADVVVATSVAAADRHYRALPVVSSAAHHSGVVCSIDHVARSADEKRLLRASGAIVVEMEAAGVAARAEARGLPFHCVRAVTDLAGETLANDFNAALRSDGHFGTMLILRGTLRHPLARLPELCRLRQRCVRAARALGEFFADCRF